MDLTTTARVAAIIAPGQTLSAATTAALAQLITSVSAAAEVVMDRHAQSASRTEYLTVEPGQRRFSLRAWPVSAVSSVNYDLDNAWTGTALSTDDYVSPVYSPTGELVIRYALLAREHEVDAPSALRVIYTGGMAADATAFIAAFPDIAEAVNMQVAHLWHLRTAPGISSVSGDGGSIGDGSEAWVPRALELLKSRRRGA